MRKWLLTFVIFMIAWGCCVSLYALDIITLAPNTTHIVRSIIKEAKKDGLKPNVKIIATVHYRNEPASFRIIPSVGDAFNIQTEKIILLKPDLVITFKGATSKAIIDKLKAFGLNVLEVNATSLDDISHLLETIGNAIDLKESADQLADEFRKKLNRLKPKNKSDKTVFVQLSSVPLYTVGGKGFMNQIILFCGGTNIYEDVKKEAFEVSSESVILNNPSVILVTQELSRSYRTLRTTFWQNYTQLDAVQNNRIYAINSDIVSQATFDLLKGVKVVCHLLK